MKLTNYVLICVLLFVCRVALADESGTTELIPDTEPTICYKIAWKEIGFSSGQAVALCSGTTDAQKVILCAVKAWTHPKNDGLGLTAGQAVLLCKASTNG